MIFAPSRSADLYFPARYSSCHTFCRRLTRTGLNREVVRFQIRLNQLEFTLQAPLRLAMLHPYNPIVAFLIQIFKNMAVVDLSRSRLIPAGTVPKLQTGDFIPRPRYG